MRPLPLAILILSIALPALAQASTSSLEVPIDLQFQDLAIEPAAQVELGSGLRLETNLVFDSAASELGAEELLLRHESERFSLWGGKFNPAFGRAWDQDTAPLDAHASSYEITGQLGMGGALSLGDDEASLLRVSGNLFGDPAQLSFAVSVEAQPIPGMRVHSGVLRLDEGRGLLVGVSGALSLGERSLAPLVEVARLDDHIILSTGVSMEQGGMRYSLQHSAQTGPSGDTSLLQATASWSL